MPPSSALHCSTSERIGDESSTATSTTVTTASTTGSVNGENTNSINGANSNKHSGASRFHDVLASVGLQGKLKHLDLLPPVQRQVTIYDIFCNRELKMSHIKAIGFDMDYTLAQYQQPAFDQLAFDGAKEKLVYKLGYPEEVLDFKYDHEVSFLDEKVSV
jgi:hypothetical protein